MLPEVALPSEKEAASIIGAPISMEAILSTQPHLPAETPSTGVRKFSIFRFGGGKIKEEEEIRETGANVNGVVGRRWGSFRVSNIGDCQTVSDGTYYTTLTILRPWF